MILCIEYAPHAERSICTPGAKLSAQASDALRRTGMRSPYYRMKLLHMNRNLACVAIWEYIHSLRMPGIHSQITFPTGAFPTRAFPTRATLMHPAEKKVRI